MIFRGNNRVIFPNAGYDDDGSYTIYPRSVFSQDGSGNLRRHDLNVLDANGICTYAKKYYKSSEEVSYPCPFFYFDESHETVSDGMHYIASPSLPSDVLSCDYLLYIDAYNEKRNGVLINDWYSKLHVGTTDVYTKSGLTYNLLQANVPAITLDALSGSTTLLHTYSSCILNCTDCEPVCVYSFSSINSAATTCLKSAVSSNRSSVHFVVHPDTTHYEDCYFVSEWSTTTVTEASGGAVPYLMVGINKTSGATQGGCYVYYNDLALALTKPR